MAGPKRWPWKNYREMKREIRHKWSFNFLIGAALTSPFAVMYGRSQ